MKKLYITLLIIATTTLSAQMIIGDAVGTAPANQKQSVLLEFANSNDKGLILPYVRTLPANPAPGTILVDSTTPTSAKVKFYDGSGWKLISGAADITSALANQPTTAEETTAKAIIGNRTSTADGVLVLESTTKAMVLPTVDAVENILSPSPGMMVYVKGTTKYLAIFDGAKWSFWMP